MTFNINLSYSLENNEDYFRATEQTYTAEATFSSDIVRFKGEEVNKDHYIESRRTIITNEDWEVLRDETEWSSNLSVEVNHVHDFLEELLEDYRDFIS